MSDRYWHGAVLILLGMICTAVILTTDGWTDWLLAVQLPMQGLGMYLCLTHNKR